MWNANELKADCVTEPSIVLWEETEYGKGWDWKERLTKDLQLESPDTVYHWESSSNTHFLHGREYGIVCE